MYTIKQAAARTGVAIPTIRAWERRYGVVDPTRTAAATACTTTTRSSAYRRCGSWSRSRAGGRARRPSASRIRPSIWRPSRPRTPPATRSMALRRFGGSSGRRRAPSSRGRPARRCPRHGASPRRSVREPALRAGDGRGGVPGPARDRPGLGDRGARCRRGTRRERDGPSAPRPILRCGAGRCDRPQVLVGMPPAGHHELGAFAFAVACRRGGLEVLYLGADVPLESWLRTVREHLACP